MKRLLLLAFFSFSTLAMNAQEISEDQWALITKQTADWCSNCGTWGWTFKNYLLEDNAEKPVVVWMSHQSGSNLETATSNAISSNFGGGGQPAFLLNNDNMGVASFNINDKREEFNLFVESFISLPPFAGVGSTATFDGEKITTQARAKFLVGLENGDYWLASYLVDDALVAFQSQQGNNAVHENMLRHSFNGENYFGENISNGVPVEVNQEFTVEGGLDFSGQTDIPNYADGYSVVTVLWGFVGGKYTPINLNKQAITLAVGTEDILKNVDVAAFHLGAGQVNLNITSDQNINNANIVLFDINGQTVASQKGVQINSGANQIMLEAQDLALGTYVVMIESELGSRSIKLNVR